MENWVDPVGGNLGGGGGGVFRNLQRMINSQWGIEKRSSDKLPGYSYGEGFSYTPTWYIFIWCPLICTGHVKKKARFVESQK